MSNTSVFHKLIDEWVDDRRRDRFRNHDEKQDKNLYFRQGCHFLGLPSRTVVLSLMLHFETMVTNASNSNLVEGKEQ